MAKAKPTSANKKARSAPVAAPAEAANLPAGFKTKRIITLPTLSFKDVGKGRAVLFNDAMRESQVEGKPDKDGVKPKKATIATVTDAQSGEMYICIVPTVVQSNLERDYPGEKYVGVTFWIVNMGKRKEGQRYNDYSIAEIDAD